MSDERRRAVRQDMRWKGLIIDSAGAIVSQCMMVNVSATGAKLVFLDATEVPDRFVLLLAKNGGVRRHCEVTWRAKKTLGVQFVKPATVQDEEYSHIDDALARISSKG
jgi:hypothetical protein